MTRGFVLCAACAAAIIAPAHAGDVFGNRGGLKDVYVPVNNWAGFYIGVNAGGAFDASSVSDFGITPEAAGELTVITQKFGSQFTGGGQIGYNFQWGQWVFGIEGDIDASTNLVHYLASIRGRAGYAWADYLIYATGGVGFIGFDHRVTAIDDVGAFRFSNNRNETGFVVGGGIEKKIWGNWSVGVEGLFYSFDKDVSIIAIPTEEGEFAHSSLEPDVWVVRARLNSYLVPAYVPLK
jgi:outer membrane immunogenic protein